METGTFKTAPGFCPDCGAILPMVPELGGVTCYSCERSWNPENACGDMEKSYKVAFKNKDTYLKSKLCLDEEDEEPSGPIMERQCPKCKNDKMSYATLQMRSADEGQTVFFTCTKCKYKESENS